VSQVARLPGVVDPRGSRRFADLSGPQVARHISERSILIQPLGAVEQHGPHLPMSTDLLIAEATAEAAVEALGDELDVWLLPPLAYTKSNEHAWSPGTVWLSATTMLAVLDDLGRCLASTSARKLVFLNGHGGNSALVAVANREVRLAHGLMTFLVHPFVPADQGGASAAAELGMGIHGGADETSVMLHLRPELVDLGLASRQVPEALAAFDRVRFGGSVPFGWLSNDFGPQGVIGDPTLASAELGERLFRAGVHAVVEALHEIDRFELPLR
jgi:creatinine amidohydrolase